MLAHRCPYLSISFDSIGGSLERHGTMNLASQDRGSSHLPHERQQEVRTAGDFSGRAQCVRRSSSITDPVARRGRQKGWRGAEVVGCDLFQKREILKTEHQRLKNKVQTLNSRYVVAVVGSWP